MSEERLRAMELTHKDLRDKIEKLEKRDASWMMGTAKRIKDLEVYLDELGVVVNIHADKLKELEQKLETFSEQLYGAFSLDEDDSLSSMVFRIEAVIKEYFDYKHDMAYDNEEELFYIGIKKKLDGEPQTFQQGFVKLIEGLEKEEQEANDWERGAMNTPIPEAEPKEVVDSNIIELNKYRKQVENKLIAEFLESLEEEGITSEELIRYWKKRGSEKINGQKKES